MQRLSSTVCQKQGFVIPAAIEQSPGTAHTGASIQAEQRTVRLAVPRSPPCHVEEPETRNGIHTQSIKPH